MLSFTYLGEASILHWTDVIQTLYGGRCPRRNHVRKVSTWNLQKLRLYSGANFRFAYLFFAWTCNAEDDKRTWVNSWCDCSTRHCRLLLAYYKKARSTPTRCAALPQNCCQLLLTWVTCPQSLNVVRFSVFYPTDKRTNKQTNATENNTSSAGRCKISAPLIQYHYWTCASYKCMYNNNSSVKIS